MKSFLKTELVDDIDGLPQITIRQLSVGMANELMRYQTVHKDEPMRVPPMVCKLGVPEWIGEALEDIEASLTWDQVAALSRRIYKLSGMRVEGDAEDPAKNSEPALSASSSTG